MPFLTVLQKEMAICLVVAYDVALCQALICRSRGRFCECVIVQKLQVHETVSRQSLQRKNKPDPILQHANGRYHERSA
jgi:hypothetical protein